MGRIFEPANQGKQKVSPILKNITVEQVTDGYLKTGIACEVNDGKYINFTYDREEE